MSFELSVDEGKFLIELARNAVKEYLKTRKHILTPENTPKKMIEECGVFVTISKLVHGEKQLRGLGAIADIPISQGRVILFGFPPHFRNQARGTFKILFNAIYYCASGV